MVKIRSVLFFLFFLVSAQTYGQVKKFAVFFTKKTEGNPYSLNNPSEFLSTRSVARRVAQNLPYDTTDLPVNPNYLQGLRNSGATVLYPMKWLNGAIIECTETILNQISVLPYVLNSSPLNSKIKTVSGRITPKNGTQSIDYGPSGNQNIMLGIDSMHAWGFHGEGKLIAVMDGGFKNVNIHPAFSHIFQNQKLVGVRDLVSKDGDVFQDHWHGGAVLSNIAGYLPGSLVGGAYNSSYFLIRSEDTDTENEIECAYWVVGLELADSIGADLVNSSLGYSTFDVASLNYSYQTLNGITSIASKAASMAASKGMVVLNSAGNEGNNGSWGGWISVPGDAENILTVGSVGSTEVYSGFSGKGPTADNRIKPDLVAQGAQAVVANVTSGSGITTNSGTSFSCPILCGLAAGFWQAHPDLTAFQVISLLKNSGSNRDTPNNQIGWGIPGFVKAHILAGAKPVLSFPFDVRIFPNPSDGNLLNIGLMESNTVGKASVKIMDSKGKQLLDTEVQFDLVNTTRTLKIPSWRSGIYYLNLEMGEKKFTRKLILN